MPGADCVQVSVDPAVGFVLLPVAMATIVTVAVPFTSSVAVSNA
jgi:hypothetical protein